MFVTIDICYYLGTSDFFTSFSNSFSADSTHWGLMTYICVSKLFIIGSDNGLSPGRRQAIIWINDEISLIWILGTNFSEIISDIFTFSFKKMRLKINVVCEMAAMLSRPQCVKCSVLLFPGYKILTCSFYIRLPMCLYQTIIFQRLYYAADANSY